MERTNGTTQGLKKVVAVLALMAAMASTGCGENALLNPTSDQFSAGGGANTAAHDPNPATHDPNPAAHDPNP